MRGVKAWAPAFTLVEALVALAVAAAGAAAIYALTLSAGRAASAARRLTHAAVALETQCAEARLFALPEGNGVAITMERGSLRRIECAVRVNGQELRLETMALQAGRP